TKTRLWSKTLTADQPQKMMGGYRLPESNTHGVGLFAVKDMKTGHFTDIDCFGTFVLYDTKTEVHDAIAADGVPRYMVASMCVGGEVLCRTPHYF
ncbi:unnamed protein product, partial [Ascophyllum nodosum]